MKITQKQRKERKQQIERKLEEARNLLRDNLQLIFRLERLKEQI